MLTKPKESLFGTNMVLKVWMAKIHIFTSQAAAVTVFAMLGHQPCPPHAVRQCCRSKSCPFVPRANFLPVNNAAQPARRPASTSLSPWARVAAVAGFFCFSLGHCSAATHAQCGHMSIGKSLLLRKSNERPSRLTHSSGINWAKKPRQRLSNTECLKPSE